MNYHLITYGCQMNLSDSEGVQTVFEQMGMRKVETEEEADVIGILSCSVRQKAIDKVYSKISKWNRMKNKKNMFTFISGCVLPADKLKFLKLFDLVFEMKDLPELPSMLSQNGITSPLSNSEVKYNETINKFWELEPSYKSSFEAFVPIQNGCDKFCTYCAVPYTRGREVSRPSEEIIEEVRQLIEKGYRSITLLGQNVNSYGFDKKGKGGEITFTQLLDKIGKMGDEMNNEFWLYFTSPHPRDMSNDVLETIAKYECLANQIHIPIQSGDNNVLDRMNRKHDLQVYRNIIESIRSILPTATIFTDIIVGFTGETDEELENTRMAMEEFKYNMAYIAMYSPRPGAKSHEWADDVSKDDKKKRFQILTNELMKHSHEYNKKMMNTTQKVLVKGFDRKGYLSGYNEGKIVTRILSKDESLIGQFVEAKVTSVSEFSVECEIEN